MNRCECGNTKAVRAHCCKACKDTINKADKVLGKLVRGFRDTHAKVEYHPGLLVGTK